MDGERPASDRREPVRNRHGTGFISEDTANRNIAALVCTRPLGQTVRVGAWPRVGGPHADTGPGVAS